MKIGTSLLMLALAVLAAFGGWQYARTSEARAAGRAAAEQNASLTALLAELRASQAQSADEMAALRADLARLASEHQRAPVPDVDAAVARWMEEHAPALAASTGAASAAAPGAAPASATSASGKTPDWIGWPAADIAAKLLDPNLSDDERQVLWDQLKKAGRLDELVALFEKRVEEDPKNPDKRVELGMAYVQKILEAGNSPLAGVWATKTDKAWDAALELDPKHWNARFAKAIGLSFWPPIFGKQKEAIEHFEILVAQQAEAPLDPKFQQTYLLLGNLYQQSGQYDKAAATWKKGAALFPGDPELAQKLGAPK